MMNLSLYNTIGNRYHHLRSIRTVTMMNTISHQIEQQVLKHQMPIDFYAGFQRFSAFPQQSQRYQQMAEVCRCIYVFGLADIMPPTIPGIEFIELAPGMPLTQEWFLLVDTPEFWTLLSTREVDGADSTMGRRHYDGVWTFDAPVVESASQLLVRALGKTYTPVYQRYAPLQEQNVAEVTQRMDEQIDKNRLRRDSSVTD